MSVIQGTTFADEMFYVGTGSQDMNGANGNDVVRGGAGNDIVRGGNGDDIVRGGSGDDDVRGGFGNDYVKGGEGNDTVNGGQGDDILAGGRGDDVFVFDGHWGEESGQDVVLDFTDGSDLLMVRNTGPLTLIDTPEGVILMAASGASMQLLGISSADLDASDFMGAAPELIRAPELALEPLAVQECELF
jgi:Ca2+-binding RTX toxin-like protein